MGYLCKSVVIALFSPAFLMIWEDKKCGPWRENFLPGFLSSPFSFPNQTVENSVFHPIFLPLFSILPVFTPTKHSLSETWRDNRACRYHQLANPLLVKMTSFTFPFNCSDLFFFFFNLFFSIFDCCVWFWRHNFKA